jgi:hypothetical protein
MSRPAEKPDRRAALIHTISGQVVEMGKQSKR